MNSVFVTSTLYCQHNGRILPHSTEYFVCTKGVGVNFESVVNESVATDPWYDSGGGPSEGFLRKFRETEKWAVTRCDQ